MRSRARPLSSSGCVWLLENACIEDRRVVLFAEDGVRHKLPKTLLGCGEFGSYDFTAVEVLHPRARQRFPRNASEPGAPDTLLVVPGLMAGVSLHNPFHVLHSTVPVTWQLHHPSYGLCVPRHELDVRFAGYSAFHGKRNANFWRAFTRVRHEPVPGDSMEQRFNIASSWRFWWGPLADRPPLPLGTDPEPRCYNRIVFGRELFRTGRGGFVTPRVLAFYRRYMAQVLGAEGRRRSGEPKQLAWAPTADTEWAVFEYMHPDAPVAGAAEAVALWALKQNYRAPFFTPEGVVQLGRQPFRLWKAEGWPASADAGSPVLEPVDTRLARSAAPGPPGAARRWVNLLLVQRPKGAGRWIANLDELLAWVEAWQHPRARLAVLVADLGELHTATQWQLATQAHVLVGVTGAALAWAAFLPRGGVVLDVFPPGSGFCNEGWGRNAVSHYGGLARLAGVQHTCMVHPVELQGPRRSDMTADEQAKLEVREKLGGFWHGQNVRLDLAKFQVFLDEGVDRVLAAIPG